MTYRAIVVADSIAHGTRLTSLEVTFPRFILAEFNTHRAMSRNSAPSRAIPVEKRIAQVREDPFVPEAFTKNQKGMQAAENVGEGTHVEAHHTWLEAAEAAARYAEHLAEIGIHKQHANRLLEPFCWHTVIVTATEWENFFRLRTHKAAQPEMQITAKLMREAYEASTPRQLDTGDWHLPYVDVAHEGVGRRPLIYALPGVPITGGLLDADVSIEEAYRYAERAFLPYVAASVVRCAAVSYLRQEAERPLAEILTRHDNLAASGHWSPFEHQAKVATHEEARKYGHWRLAGGGRDDSLAIDPTFGNFRAPWIQYRKTFAGEAVWEGDES